MSGNLISPSTDTAVRGLAIAGMALLVLNYFAARSLFDAGPLIPALVIGVGSILIETFLPRAEYLVESNL